MNYYDELTKAMTMLAKHPRTLFVGQSVRYDGQAMYKSLADVPMDRRIEYPVCEDMQLGFCTGLSLEGFIPVCIYPRFDFLLLAANQLVNHLDKIAQISGFRPKVIIRTAVGSTSPLHPGPQHSMNHTAAFRLMCKNIDIVELNGFTSIVDIYKYALESNRSSIIVEHMEKYQNGN